ncbi:uncharacterized protein LOC119726303 [Patiria miniata]|uniref:Mediator of RNA polymerase II transcription subunit 31 n=1 Tax=Patiria miniata TaxID=46514 RepID=A0A913ZQ93_PATMI|nr:uncharacterized protein LOC119726303 [Patiria miniata]
MATSVASAHSAGEGLDAEKKNRFQVELEFVQCLANPHYLNYVIKEHVNTLRFHSCTDKKHFPLWTQLTQRHDFKVKSSTTVCSNHFKYGQPYPDELHPSLFLRGYDLPETLKRAPVKSRALDLTTPLPAI